VNDMQMRKLGQDVGGFETMEAPDTKQVEFAMRGSWGTVSEILRK
jgi:hypothetical protein